MVTQDKDSKTRFTIKAPSDGWFYLLVIMCLGEPDIIDGVVSVLQSLAKWIGTL